MTIATHPDAQHEEVEDCTTGSDEARTNSPERGVVQLLLLFAIVLFGVGIRAYRLEDRSVWFDEATSWRVSSLPLRDMMLATARDSHVPAYFLLLKAWCVAFGDSVGAMRGLSVVLGALTMVGAYLLVAEAYRSDTCSGMRSADRARWGGIFAAALICVSLLQIKCAWEMRMYTLGTALLTYSSWMLFRAINVRRGAWKWWTGHSVVTLLFAYTHHYALFSILAQMLFLLGCVWARPKRADVRAVPRSTRWGAVASYTIVAVGWSPWLPILVGQIRQVEERYWTGPLDMWGVLGTWYETFLDAPAPRVGAVLVAVACLFILAALVTRRNAANWYVLSLVVCPFALGVGVSVLGRNVLVARYLTFAHLFMLIGIAIVVSRIPSSTIRGFVAILLLATGLLVYLTSWSSLDIGNKPGLRGAVEYVRANHKREEPVIVGSPLLYFPARYYLPKEEVCRMYTDGSPLPHYEGGPFTFAGDLISRNQVERTPPGRVWVICRNPLSGDMPFPKNWRIERTEAFREAYGWQGTVFTLAVRVLPAQDNAGHATEQ